MKARKILVILNELPWQPRYLNEIVMLAPETDIMSTLAALTKEGQLGEVESVLYYANTTAGLDALEIAVDQVEEGLLLKFSWRAVLMSWAWTSTRAAALQKRYELIVDKMVWECPWR